MTSSTFEKLLNDALPSLRALIRFMGVHAHDVDDLTQDICVVAWEKRDSLKDEDGMLKWLRTIMRNRIMNYRSKNKRRLSKMHLLMAESVEFEDSMLDVLEKKSWILRMQKCLEKLPEKNKKLLLARYVEDMNSRKLAETLNRTASSVRGHLLRLREALIKCIGPYLETT
ncbi:MAG: sigma-70 family RNA polymerase sigma factor [Planctomycetes bacterium]|nr:sigma-70 family RNA polymerase sigma factor [Planctomycetota bacterium]